jgi:hypothetical protein
MMKGFAVPLTMLFLTVFVLIVAVLAVVYFFNQMG